MKAFNKMKNGLMYLLICLVVVNITMSSCHSTSGKPENEATATVATAALTKVLVAQVQTDSVHSSVTIAGTAMANQEVKVYAMSNGYVESWKHDIGETVAQGEPLAILTNPELMQQQAEAKARLDGDKSIYDRLEGVYKKTPELVPLEQVDEAKAKYESAVAELSAINSQIDYLTVKSPFLGVVTHRYIDDGAVVQDALSKTGADPLFMVQDVSVIRLTVEVPEVNSPYINKGTDVKLTFPDLPNTVYTEKVSRISYGLSQDTKTMEVQIDIPNKDGKIHPGMFANAEFSISSQPNVICVPNQSIAVYEEEPYIYKAVPMEGTGHSDWSAGVKCRIQKMKVQLGVNNKNNTEVRYTNLNPGDMIVVSGKSFCTDGAIVVAKQGEEGKNVTTR